MMVTKRERKESNLFKNKKAIITRKYKGIYHINTKKWEIYDLEKDKLEKNPLKENKEFKELKESLLKWINRSDKCTKETGSKKAQEKIKERLKELGYF